MKKDIFDDIVIGSSPMMLIRAIELSAKGRRVCLLEKQSELGGVWRNVRVAEELDVEIACHLIEDFPGVYEYLEEVSGIPFEPLQDQPIRVLKNDSTAPYSTRSTLFLSVLWVLILIVLHKLRLAKPAQNETQKARIHVLRRKVVDFFRFQLPIMLRGSRIQAPVTGFADFISVLENKCRDQKVDIREFDVQQIEDEGSCWRLVDQRSEKILAREVHCTTSANLKRIDRGRFQAVEPQFSSSACILVEVSFADIREKTSYAAFWSDPEVVRVARIDQREPRSSGWLYLIQLRKDFGEFEDSKQKLESLIHQSMVRAKVLSSKGKMRLIGPIQCSHMPHRQQLPDGLIDRSFYGYYSAGNLASGLARWPKLNNGGRRVKK